MTKDEEGYNGWKNYETWAVNVWMTNTPGDEEWLIEKAEYATSISELAHSLEDGMGEIMPELGSTLWADLLGAAFSEVDWYELAEHYWSDYREEGEI